MTRLTSLGGLPFGASNYSLFVAPFKYSLDEAGSSCGASDSLVFSEVGFDPDVTEADIWRAEYMTGETGAVFFDVPGNSGAVWHGVDCETKHFELGGQDAGNTVPFGVDWILPRRQGDDDSSPAERAVRLSLRVRLVLFDIPTAVATGRRAAERSGCIGFLVLDVGFPEGVDLATVLDFNNGFRHLRWAYPHEAEGYADRLLAADAANGDGSHPPTSPACATLPCCTLRRGEAVLEADRGVEDVEIGMWRYLARQRIRVDGKERRVAAPDFSVYPDNRAFVVSHATVDGVPWSVDEGSALWMLWRQLLEVEPREDVGRALTTVEDQWTRQRTYWRWALSPGLGRLYGYSNFSFCSLCAGHSWENPARHFRQMYFDQTLLVLYQRVAIFSFSRDLSALTQEWKQTSWKGVRARFSAFRASFAQFVNLYWYPVFTNQLQGIEMYELARRELDNKELFDELSAELATTGDYIEGSAAEASGRAVGQLAVAALFVGVVGLVLGWLGTNLLQYGDDGGLTLVWPAGWAWVATGIVVGLILFAAALFALLFWRRRA